MKTVVLVILFFFPILLGNTQGLVPNNSFEDTLKCPTSTDQVYNAPPWFRPTIGYSLGTSDYFNICSSNSSTSIPKNLFGYQNPHTGVAYAGIGVYFSEWELREYIEVKIKTALIKGKKYCVELYVSLADSSDGAIKEIGMYFSKDSVLSSDWLHISVIPQIENNYFLSDTNEWMLISGEYIAEGGERFIAIGNFRDDANTSVIDMDSVPCTSGNYCEIYYYIDDVSVYCCDDANTQIELGENTVICAKDSIKIGVEPAPGYVYKWQSANGLSNTDTNFAQVFVKPLTTTTYYLFVEDTSKMESCNNTTTDSITITVKNCDTVATKPNSVFIPNIFSPNGDGNNDVLYVLGNNIAHVNLVIYNRWGERVFESTDIKKGWDGSYMGKNKESIAAVFIYYCKVIYADGTEEELKGNITLVK
jgi:gliding motility-associated-like protein